MLHSRAIMRAQGFHFIPEEDGKSAQWMVLQPHEEMQEGKAGDKDGMGSHCVRHWSWSVMNRTITQSCSEATPPCYHLEVSPLSPRSHTWELDSRPQILPVRAPPKLRDCLMKDWKAGRDISPWCKPEKERGKKVWVKAMQTEECPTRSESPQDSRLSGKFQLSLGNWCAFIPASPRHLWPLSPMIVSLVSKAPIVTGGLWGRISLHPLWGGFTWQPWHVRRIAGDLYAYRSLRSNAPEHELINRAR